jgi:hypothetical protein
MQRCQGSGEECYIFHAFFVSKSYGIIFWGNTGNGVTIFKIHKRFKTYQYGKENGFMQRNV